MANRIPDVAGYAGEAAEQPRRTWDRKPLDGLLSVFTRLRRLDSISAPFRPLGRTQAVAADPDRRPAGRRRRQDLDLPHNAAMTIAVKRAPGRWSRWRTNSSDLADCHGMTARWPSRCRR